MSTAPATAKKVNATTEAILGAAAAKFTQSAANLKSLINSAGEVLETLGDKESELSISIVAKTDALALLDVEYAEKRRTQGVTLKLEEQADIAAVAKKYADANGKTIIDTDVLNAQQGEFEDLKVNFKDKVRAEAQAAIVAATSSHRQELALQEANFKATQATTQASITSLQGQLDATVKENARLYVQIDEERKASIERAKAQGSSVVNVSGQGR